VRGESDAIEALPGAVENVIVASKRQILENLPGYSEQALTHYC
jgi:hypothetical protein